MPQSTALALGVSLLASGWAIAETTPASRPIVPGFERFHHGPQVDRTMLGRVLLSELGCVNCHTSPSLPKRPAPNLDEVGSRLRLPHLRQFLDNPHHAKPGTLMPQIIPDGAQRSESVEALVHLLASTGTPRPFRHDLRAIVQGYDLYTRVGCIACHGPLDRTAKPLPVEAPVMPLRNLQAKYSLEGLSRLLEKPHEIRPNGRMPTLLNAIEARRVAHFLLQHAQADLTIGLGTTRYAYYEGDWERVPDFDKLRPTHQGLSPAFDVGIAARPSSYALRFEGYVRIEREGEFTFTLESDDGSLLFVDGQKIVDNDGFHATKGEAGRCRLQPGIHRVVVGFFQGGGGAELRVRIQGPGLRSRDLGEIVAATEEGLSAPPSPKAVPVEDRLEVQPELVRRGKEVFVSSGCAQCHSLTVQGETLASKLQLPSLDRLDPTKGCLGDRPFARYSLSEQQRQAVVSALKSLQAVAMTSAERVQRTLLIFNCVACHQRGGIGGPPEPLNRYFTTTQPEMGDEARIPPPLDGVTAKLQPDYLRSILDKGAHDRPYMHTRMPGFGLSHLPGFVEALSELDKSYPRPEVRFDTTIAKVKAAGRFLVGSQALGCIKCHTFAGQRAEGVQGIDLTLMTRRLQPGWFHRYLLDPQQIRPGTRMPASWPDGGTFYPQLLGGKSVAQIESIWQYLSDGPKAQAPVGLGRQSIPLIPTKSAILYRNFMQGAGTRGIGVGYPERVNLAFDAQEMRWALIWQGAFIDAGRHWTDRGAGFEGPLGDNVVRWHEGVPFARLASPDAPWPSATARELGYRFRGYRLTPDDRPTFLYSFDGVVIEDFPNGMAGQEPYLRRTFRLVASSAVPDLYFRAAVAERIAAQPGGIFLTGPLKLVVSGADAKIRRSGAKDELLVPVRFVDGKAEFHVEVHW
jgi:mono/diheme cytochrome c family protein